MTKAKKKDMQQKSSAVCEDIFSTIAAANGYSTHEIDFALSVLETPVEEQAQRRFLDAKYLQNMYLQRDIVEGTYKGLSEADFEDKRLAALDALEAAECFSDKLDILRDAAAEIATGLDRLYYNDALLECSRMYYNVIVGKKLIEAGHTPEELVKFLVEMSPEDVDELVERCEDKKGNE